MARLSDAFLIDLESPEKPNFYQCTGDLLIPCAQLEKTVEENNPFDAVAAKCQLEDYGPFDIIPPNNGSEIIESEVLTKYPNETELINTPVESSPSNQKIKDFCKTVINEKESVINQECKQRNGKEEMKISLGNEKVSKHNPLFKSLIDSYRDKGTTHLCDIPLSNCSDSDMNKLFDLLIHKEANLVADIIENSCAHDYKDLKDTTCPWINLSSSSSDETDEVGLPKLLVTPKAVKDFAPSKERVEDFKKRIKRISAQFLQEDEPKPAFTIDSTRDKTAKQNVHHKETAKCGEKLPNDPKDLKNREKGPQKLHNLPSSQQLKPKKALLGVTRKGPLKAVIPLKNMTKTTQQKSGPPVKTCSRGVESVAEDRLTGSIVQPAPSTPNVKKTKVTFQNQRNISKGKDNEPGNQLIRQRSVSDGRKSPNSRTKSNFGFDKAKSPTPPRTASSEKVGGQQTQTKLSEEIKQSLARKALTPLKSTSRIPRGSTAEKVCALRMKRPSRLVSVDDQENRV